MAFRKETIKQQFTQAIGPLLEPGEQLRGGVFAQSGPTPWLTGAIGVPLMLILGMRYYFVGVTDRRVLFMRASFFGIRPKGMAWADPLGSGVVTDALTDAKLWNRFRYLKPGESKPTQINVGRWWASELREMLPLMAPLAPPAGGTPPAVPPVPPPPPVP